MHDFMKFYTGPPKFEFGRVEFASGGPGGPPASKVNVEPCDVYCLKDCTCCKTLPTGTENFV